ncbi:MAG: DUF4340 domain-containing protein [Planctomycetes bacterium]|nr:DUF4340 domain-containing protein [Planctomycetota bacterium]
MNPKTTLIMGLGLLVMLGIIAGLKLAQAPTEVQKLIVEGRVFPALNDVDADRFTEASLDRGDEHLHFVHSEDGDRWQMTKPVDVLADSSRVRDIVTALKNLSKRTTGGGKDERAGVFETKDSAALAQYGLDSQAKTITLTYKPKGSERETRTVTLQVGGATADKEGLYVKLPEKPFVFVVNKSSLDSLDKKVNEFRQQKLVTISRWDSDRVRLEWPDRKLTAEKKDAKWRLIEPIEDKAETNKVEELVGKLGDLKADGDADFVEDDPKDLAKLGLKLDAEDPADKPQLVAEIRKPGKTSTFADDKKKKAEKEKPPVVERILIGKPVEGKEDKVYAKLADQKYVIAVSVGVLNDLNKQPNDLRVRDLVEITQFNVDYVAIERSAGKIALGKKDNDWELYQPKTIKADSNAITDLVRKIDDLQIKEFIDQGDAKEYELEQPPVTVAIYERGLKKAEDTEAKDKKKKDAKDKDEKKEENAEGPPEPEGEPIKVFFGKRDEEQKLIYVKRGDGPGIFAVADDGLWELLNRDYLAYRTKQLLTFSRGDVAKLSIHREDKTTSVERKQEGEAKKEVWRMTEPVDAPADSKSVSDILFDLSPLTAKKFVAEGVTDFEPYGLHEPKIRATVTLKAEGDKKPDQHVLLIGGEVEGDGGHYAKLGDADLVFAVDQRTVGDLNAELHDHDLLKFDIPKVEGLTLTWPDAKLELAYKKPEGKTEKQWSVLGDEDFKLDADKTRAVGTFLSTLSTDKFAQYQGDFKEEYGFEKPALLIEVKLEGDSTAKTLRIGSAAQGEKRYVATAEKSGGVGLIPEDRVKDLLTGPKQFAVAEEKKEETKPEPTKPEEGKKDDAKPEEGKKEEVKKTEKKDDEKSDEKKSEEKKEDKKPTDKSDSRKDDAKSETKKSDTPE